MKSTILILALFLFSFSIGSTETSENVPLEQCFVTGWHFTGIVNGINRYVEITISWEARLVHEMHGDCFAPCQAPR